MNQQFICRMALPSDCVQNIAKYIHLTDPYIYPQICTDPQDVGLPSPLPAFRVAEGKRIGIDYAEEAVDFPWRFTLQYTE